MTAGPPSVVHFLDGQITDTLDWSSDGGVTGAGFKICTSPAPPSPPSAPNAWLEGVRCPYGSFSTPTPWPSCLHRTVALAAALPRPLGHARMVTVVQPSAGPLLHAWMVRAAPRSR